MMNARTGRAMARSDHIRQSLTDILTTPIGSCLMRRPYGSEMPGLIDQPLNGATVLRIYAATAYIMLRSENRGYTSDPYNQHRSHLFNCHRRRCRSQGVSDRHACAAD
ncbi:hypothetical protein ACIPF8_22860 [Collimonas sp. NPDC087041]|uniref:hypothetical protein n=1 Tax=Collimonas sp. NPDC087041 TaxID=3363960 RepID=UPI0038093C93